MIVRRRDGGMKATANAGHARLSAFGKNEVAKSMFGKGRAFVGAYILLRQHNQAEPTEYVALQNLCQGVEVTVKSLLLFKDYDRFQPLFGKPKGYGHDLPRLVKAALEEYSMHPLSRKSMTQFQLLNEFYSNHRLRYGNGVDLLIDPNSIERNRVVKLLARVIKIVLKVQKKV